MCSPWERLALSQITYKKVMPGLILSQRVLGVYWTENTFRNRCVSWPKANWEHFLQREQNRPSDLIYWCWNSDFAVCLAGHVRRGNLSVSRPQSVQENGTDLHPCQNEIGTTYSWIRAVPDSTLPLVCCNCLRYTINYGNSEYLLELRYLSQYSELFVEPFAGPSYGVKKF
jgi:hypothetical protein